MKHVYYNCIFYQFIYLRTRIICIMNKHQVEYKNMLWLLHKMKADIYVIFFNQVMNMNCQEFKNSKKETKIQVLGRLISQRNVIPLFNINLFSHQFTSKDANLTNWMKLLSLENGIPSFQDQDFAKKIIWIHLMVNSNAKM